MKTYHKIQTVFLRDPATNYKKLDMYNWSKWEFYYLADALWTCTEKVDGTNIRVMFKDGKVSFAGKTDAAQMPAPLLKHLEETFLSKQEKMSETFNEGSEVCLYGEGYGAKIQKGGGNYGPDQKFVLFDININGIWLSREMVEHFAEVLDLNLVPIIAECPLLDAVELVKEGFNSTWGNFTAEGLICKPRIELLNSRGERIITKIKHKDF